MEILREAGDWDLRGFGERHLEGGFGVGTSRGIKDRDFEEDWRQTF